MRGSNRRTERIALAEGVADALDEREQEAWDRLCSEQEYCYGYDESTPLLPEGEDNDVLFWGDETDETLGGLIGFGGFEPDGCDPYD